jgi:hypothetical protein
MIARGRTTLILIVAITLLNYASFPLIFDSVGPNTAPYNSVIAARTLLAVTLVVMLVREAHAFQRLSRGRCDRTTPSLSNEAINRC